MARIVGTSAKISVNGIELNEIYDYSLTVSPDNAVNFKYNAIGRENNMHTDTHLDITWLTRDNYAQFRKPGLLFGIENRKDLFCDNPLERIEVRFVNLYDQQPLWDNYQMLAFVHGFEIPHLQKVDGRALPGVANARGNPQDGNFRMVYVYADEATDIGVNAGITVHGQNGSWSNWSPHAFEQDAVSAPVRIYPDFCEKFAYITERESMWGIYGYADADGNRAVRPFIDKQIVDIPLGAHFSIAMPGQRLAYIWAYVNGGSKKT